MLGFGSVHGFKHPPGVWARHRRREGAAIMQCGGTERHCGLMEGPDLIAEGAAQPMR